MPLTLEELESRTERFNSREEWLAGRRKRVQASDLPGILGVGYSNQSAITIWADKTGKAIDCPVEFNDKRLKIGSMMEPTLRQILSEELGGMNVFTQGSFAIVHSDQTPHLGASLDALVSHREYGLCPAELKNVSAFNKSEWEDEPPIKFQAQVQAQLAVTGADVGFLLGLIGGNEPIVVEIPRNEKFIKAMMLKVAEFWGYVERNEEPPADASYATSAFLAKLHPDDNGGSVVLGEEFAELDRKLVTIKEEIKQLDGQKTAIENRIKAAIGDNTFAMLPCGAQYTWKTQERAEYTVKASKSRVLRRKD